MVDYEFNIPTGSYVLPVCISGEDNELVDLIAALELYRRLRKSGQDYPAFDAVLRAMSYADNPQDSPCLDIPQSSGTCWSVDATSQAIRFFPNDPFDPVPENRPIIGQWERWQIALQRLPEWADSILDLAENQTAFDRNIGYFPNDCFVVPPDESANDVMQFFESLNAIRKAEFPYIEIELQGAGELELHLLQVPFGGSAIIVYDMEFDVYAYLWDLVNGGSLPSGNIIQTELEREIATFPPESNEENVIEIDFTDDTDHIVRVYFVPRIDYTALDFLGNGGGIREVSACGGLALKTESGELITKTTHRLDEFTKGNFIMTTQDDLCRAIICASEKLAQRILLANDSENVRYSVEIDKDTGQTMIKTTGAVDGLKPDVAATANEYHNGGVYNQARNIANLFSKIKEMQDNSYSSDIIQRITAFTIDVIDAATFNTIVDNYVLSEEDIVIDVDALSEAIFCRGLTIGSIQYARDNGHSEIEIDYILQFVSNIPASTMGEWYEEGTQKPLTEFESYDCVLRESWELTMNSSQYASKTAVYTNNLPNWDFSSERAIRVTASGRFQSISEPLKTSDVYWNTLPDGSLGFSPTHWTMIIGARNILTATPARSEDGDYTWTVRLPAGDYTHFSIKHDRGAGAWITDPETDDTLTVIIEDLGAV